MLEELILINNSLTKVGRSEIITDDGFGISD